MSTPLFIREPKMFNKLIAAGDSGEFMPGAAYVTQSIMIEEILINFLDGDNGAGVFNLVLAADTVSTGLEDNLTLISVAVPAGASGLGFIRVPLNIVIPPGTRLIGSCTVPLRTAHVTLLGGVLG